MTRRLRLGPTSRRRALRGLAALPLASLCATLAPPALAHRSRVVLTRVVTGGGALRWEFITTMHRHDAALALSRLTGDATADPATAVGQAQLALELERTLSWSDPGGTALQPVVEGAELLGSDLVLYQSSPQPMASGDYTVESRFLHTVHPDLTHTVQFDVVDPPRIARLTAARPRATFRWTPVNAGP